MAAHRQLDYDKGLTTTVDEGPPRTMERLGISVLVVECARLRNMESALQGIQLVLDVYQNHIFNLDNAAWEEFSFALHPAVLVELRPYL